MARQLELATILEQQQPARQIYRLRLRAPAIAAAGRAGQFVMIRINDGIDPLLRRPFSFHRIDREAGTFEILYRVVGRGTRELARKPPGATLSCLGPLGNGFTLVGATSGQPVALVAGGIGIAPLVQLMAELAARIPRAESHRLMLFYGARNAEELLPESTFEPFGCIVHTSTDDGSKGFCGLVTQLLDQVTRDQDLTFSALYACGTLAMQYHVARWAEQHRIPAQLSLESLMACGLGACLGCALPAPHPKRPGADHYQHVCVNGPVFEPGSIRWDQIEPPPTPPTFACR